MAARAFAQLRLLRTEDGGLKRPLSTPTPSLVFKPEGTDQLGLVGVIHIDQDADLLPGSDVVAEVVFPMEDSGRLVAAGRRFVLWHGRVVGTADLREVQ